MRDESILYGFEIYFNYCNVGSNGWSCLLYVVFISKRYLFGFYNIVDVVAGFFCDDWIPYVAFLIFVVLFMGEFVRLFTEIIEFLFESF